MDVRKHLREKKTFKATDKYTVHKTCIWQMTIFRCLVIMQSRKRFGTSDYLMGTVFRNRLALCSMFTSGTLFFHEQRKY